jgi:hypothetical protein
MRPNKEINFGKITQIDEDGVAFYFALYLKPENLKTGKQYYHSQYELIKTEKVEKEFVKNIQKKIQVFSNIELWIDCADGKNMPYFYRQMIKDFDLENYQIVPAIKKICVCGKVYNPDHTLKDIIDLKEADLPAILKNEILKCPKCDF